jgi:ABC-type transport system substrate-binding protein
MNGEISASDAPTLAARYGPGSPAARAGHQQYFVTAQPELDFLALNSHRPLFANTRLRLAVSYAIDRAALAALGGGFGPLPDQPTDHYIPPGVPGFTDTHFYPLTGDPAKARQLAAGHQGATAILYTCDQLRCDQQAHLITTELAAIGLNVETKPLSPDALFTKILNPGEPFDMVLVPWAADYLDPDNFLNLVLETNTMIPAFNDPTYQTQLAAAARLSGPKRYLTYARIDADLTRNAAPWIAYGNASTHELFSARIGCQTYGVYDVDLAALCIRNQR